MRKEEIIEKAYSAFSALVRPEQCTNYLDLEDAGFNRMLLSATRQSLAIEQLGTVGWGPISHMNPEALAYFMPRLIELAVSGAMDRDGDPFYCRFINAFCKDPDNERFRLFGTDQKAIMADTFEFLCQNYQAQLEIEDWLDEAQQGVIEWRSIFVK
ncbi:MAG: hypothetical protein K9N10_21655 [Deltaproteobacteria bacterium]|nr:hypothetical protein [Deltaproteobacteria bacterium]